MKKLIIFTLIISTITLVACTGLSNNSGSSTASTAAGTACGKTLANLYTHYKSAGKIDMTNSNTILQVIELGTYTSALIANKNNDVYKKSFATGLVLGSSGLIMDNNSMQTVNSLIGLPNLSGMKSSTPVNSSTANEISTNLGNLMKNLKK